MKIEFRSFEKELPQGYQPVLTISNLDKRMVFIMLMGNLIIAIIVMAFLLWIRPVQIQDILTMELRNKSLQLLVMLIGYVIGHELLHGIVYWFITKQKLTFGLTLTVAYCGVPDIYVYRKTALLSLVAPLSFFFVVFTLTMILSISDLDYLLYAFMMAIHLAGCIGDLYVLWLLLFKYKEETVLIRDTGPQQVIYRKEME